MSGDQDFMNLWIACLDGTASVSERTDCLSLLQQNSEYEELALATLRFESDCNQHYFKNDGFLDAVLPSLIEVMPTDGDITQPQSQAKRRLQFPLTVSLAVAATLLMAIAYYLVLDHAPISFIRDGQHLYYDDGSEIYLFGDVEYIPSDSHEFNIVRGSIDVRVQKQKQQTFSVQTPQAVIEVVGTAFSVISHDNQVSAHLREGLIQVHYQQQRYTVQAGQSVSIHANGIFINQDRANMILHDDFAWGFPRGGEDGMGWIGHWRAIGNGAVCSEDAAIRSAGHKWAAHGHNNGIKIQEEDILNLSLSSETNNVSISMWAWNEHHERIESLILRVPIVDLNTWQHYHIPIRQLFPQANELHYGGYYLHAEGLALRDIWVERYK